MAADEAPPVDERALLHVLMRLRDIRREAVTALADPWAFRQAIITVLSIDTECALQAGVKAEALFDFDEAAEIKAAEFVESLPEEERDRGW